MEIQKTKLLDAYVIIPDVHGDARGWFAETYTKHKLSNISAVEFVQDNQSYSAQKGIVRGLHCQVNPHCQTKLIRCTRGAIADVIVDIRRGSPTYLQWIKVELSAANHKQLYIPQGFLHGFVTLTDEVEVQYKVDDYYQPDCDRSVRFNDPLFGIDWGIGQPILSAKDQQAPLFKDSDCLFDYRVSEKA